MKARLFFLFFVLLFCRMLLVRSFKNTLYNCFTRVALRNKYLTGVINRRLSRMADEEEKALENAGVDENGDSVFGKIARGEMKVDLVYEDDKVMAFNDINPQAPVHIILIPKKRDGLTRLSKAEERHKDVLGHLMWAVSEIVRQQNLGDFRLVVNNGPTACQSIYYLHLHILAQRQMRWPPG